VISYLTAEEASYVGLEKKIAYFPENVFPTGECNNPTAIKINRTDPPKSDNETRIVVRKPHHLSEITVTQTDGKR